MKAVTSNALKRFLRKVFNLDDAGTRAIWAGSFTLFCCIAWLGGGGFILFIAGIMFAFFMQSAMEWLLEGIDEDAEE